MNMTIGHDLISVIIPIYKVEKYLDKCISSIVNQTYNNIEIILVDDGSPDKCPEICRKWANQDTRIRVIHKENGGLSDARNHGIELAKGAYLMFIDSDDTIAVNMVQLMHERIIQDHSDLVLCNILYVDEQDCAIFKEDKPLPIRDGIISKDEAFDHLSGNKSHHYVVACNKLYPRKIFFDLKFKVGKLHEDEFIGHLVYDQCEKISCISRPLYRYTQRANSITNSDYTLPRTDAIEAFISRALFYIKKDRKHQAVLCLDHMRGFLFLAYTSLDLSDKENKERLHSLLRDYRKVYCSLFFQKQPIKDKILNTVAYINPYMINLRHPYKQIISLMKNVIKKIIQLDKIRKFRFKSRIKKLIKNKTKKNIAFILATPEHGNLGDHAIVQAEKAFLANKDKDYCVIEISDSEYTRYKDILIKLISIKDTIIIDGGGNLGTLWAREDNKISEIIHDYRKNKIIIFPQTCFYDQTDEANDRLSKNKHIYESAKQLTISLRDEQSYTFFKEQFPKTRCVYTPDIVLYISNLSYTKQREGCLLCMRTDHESILSSNDKLELEVKLNSINLKYNYTDTVIKSNISAIQRDQALDKKWNEFASAKLIITDRLHAMIFAAITATPCLALDNRSKKVSGVYHWLRHLPYIKTCQSHRELIELIADFVEMENNQYDAVATLKDFEPLSQVLSNDTHQ